MPTPPPSTGFIYRLDGWLSLLAARGHRRPWASLALVAVLLAISLVGASRLSLDTDLTSALPESHDSVRALHAMEARFGGVGSVTVVGMGIAPDRLHAFADDMATRLAALPHIRWVDVRRPVDFFRDRALYYLPAPELGALVDRVEARIDWERRKANPMLIDLEETEAPALGIEDLESKAESGGGARWIRRMARDAYYTNPARGMVAVMARPDGRASDLALTREVVLPARALVANLDMTPYGPDAHVGLTGRFPKRLDQQEELSSDLGVSSTLALVLMLGYLAFHFRRLRAMGLVVVPLLTGLAWMFGLAGFAFGQLNILTAFAGVILMGLGIDHGIHLLSRYEQERVRGAPGAEAVTTAFRTTGRGVLLAALTTAAALASLSFSEFRAFREFGVLTAFGTLAIVAAYVLCLPALLALVGRGGTEVSQRPRPSSTLARLMPRWSPAMLWLGLIGLGLLIANGGALHFDQNFTALQSKGLASFRLDAEVNRLLGYTQTPMVVMANTEQDARTIASRLTEARRAGGDGSTVDFAATVSDLVPLAQDQKRAELDRLERALERVKPGWLSPKDKQRLDDLRTEARARPFAVEDLPIEVRRQFQRPDGTLDRSFVLLFSTVDQSDGSAVRRLAKEVRTAPLAGIDGALVAGEGMVLADVLDIVEAEAPRLLLGTIAVSIAVMWLLLGSLRFALLGLAPAVVTLLATFGLMPLCGAELNYLNVVMLPALVGMSLDGGLHVLVRHRSGVPVPAIVEETGRGIAGSLLTTGLGFAALLVADHEGLTSISQLVLIGLTVNLIVCLVVLPALLQTLGRRAPRGERLAQGVATVGLIGLSPRAPGTFGAVVALPVAALLQGSPWWLLGAALAVGTVAAVYLIDRYIATSGHGDDPQEVVVDELAGCLVALAFVPWTPFWVIAAFVLFRVFDIVKPGPIRVMQDRVHGGVGVMGDDLLAGVFAGVLLLALRVVGGAVLGGG